MLIITIASTLSRTQSHQTTDAERVHLSCSQVQQDATYSNVLCQVTSSITIRVGWTIPYNSINGPSNSGDQIRIYYGTSVSSVVAPYTGATVIDGGVPSEVGSLNGAFQIGRLKPATTYYFSVVGYFAAGIPPAEIEATRSASSFATKTFTGKPAQVKNVTITIPPGFVDQLSGSIIVQWDPLMSFCTASDGVFLSDGSVATCPRGEDLPLQGLTLDTPQRLLSIPLSAFCRYPSAPWVSTKAMY